MPLRLLMTDAQTDIPTYTHREGTDYLAHARMGVRGPRGEEESVSGLHSIVRAILIVELSCVVFMNVREIRPCALYR